MREVQQGRVHMITGGYPVGALPGHDMDFARIRLLELLEERGVQATVGNDFTDIHRWLPGTALMLTYTAGPHLDGDQNQLVRRWMEGRGPVGRVARDQRRQGEARGGRDPKAHGQNRAPRHPRQLLHQPPADSGDSRVDVSGADNL